MALLLSALVCIVSSQQVPQPTATRQNQATLFNVNQASSLGPGMYSAPGPYQISQESLSAPYQSYAVASKTPYQSNPYPYQTSGNSLYQASASLYAQQSEAKSNSMYQSAPEPKPSMFQSAEVKPSMYQSAPEAKPNMYQSAPEAKPNMYQGAADTATASKTPSSPYTAGGMDNSARNLQNPYTRATPPAAQRSMSPFYRGAPRGRAFNQPYVRRSPQLTPQQQQQAQQQAQQQLQRSLQPTSQPSDPISSPPTPAPYGPPAPQSIQSRTPISAAQGSAAVGMYGVVAPTPSTASSADSTCVSCVCKNWWQCCDYAWGTFCDGISSTVCSNECTGRATGTQQTAPVSSEPASLGQFCGRGLWMRPLECDTASGLQCLASSNTQISKADIGLCYQVSPVPVVTKGCSAATPRCSCTIENCGTTRGWDGKQGVCALGAATTSYDLRNCDITPSKCLETADKCECAFSSCWGWTAVTSQCNIDQSCVDRRVQLADAAVQGFIKRDIRVLAWDFDSTIINVDTASGSYPDLNALVDRMDQDFIALSKAAARAGLQQAITSYNSIGMVFVDGQLTGGPALLKAILAKVLGENNRFVILAFESKNPSVEGKNVHLQMLMQQLQIQRKASILLIDDDSGNVKLAKAAGYSTAQARTGRGVDLRMLAN